MSAKWADLLFACAAWEVQLTSLWYYFPKQHILSFLFFKIIIIFFPLVKLLVKFCYQEYIEKTRLGTVKKCFKNANYVFVVNMNWIYYLWQNKHI